MSKRKKNIIAIIVPIFIFIISASLFYFTTLQYKQSFIQLYNSKIKLEKGNYNLYDAQKEEIKRHHFDIDVLENSKLQTLKISISPEKKTWFIRTSTSVTLDGKKYQLLRQLKISKNGLYDVEIFNSTKNKTNILIQNQNADNDFLKSILIYYAISILSIVSLLVVLIVLLVKSFRNNKKVATK
ncbi:hypothetical protein [Flavobacterium hungaricum]|uniref:Uncharacterized protein n=1 Tax=Flavobacterium hungaricum TaxID=2082725 RepID=A0ABR9TE97_9FLAO|nr:hypothetical protein [Flavobacterium hungaricum]MBE8723676.1 hypothetical protein [Flavobacterium hungaricum]